MKKISKIVPIKLAVTSSELSDALEDEDDEDEDVGGVLPLTPLSKFLRLPAHAKLERLHPTTIATTIMERFMSLPTQPSRQEVPDHHRCQTGRHRLIIHLRVKFHNLQMFNTGMGPQ